ncbi:MAG: hypothetical protein NUV67_00690 [archaeon]|nr:hypothetical protein [archaeon]
MGIISDFLSRIFGKKKVQGKEKPAGLAKKEPKAVAQTRGKMKIPKRPKNPPKVGVNDLVHEIDQFELEKQLKKYRKTIQEMRKEIEALRSKIKKQNIGPKQALGGVQVIYNELKTEKRNIDGEMKQTKNLMDFLEKDFLRHKVSEDMFRKKMFDYREKLHILNMEQKELGDQKNDLKKTTSEIPRIIPVSLDQLSRTENLEKLLIKQQETLEKIASQGEIAAKTAGAKIPKRQPAFAPAPQPDSKPASAPASGPASAAKPTKKEEIKTVKKGFSAAPKSESINKFLEEKSKGKLDSGKLVEAEQKIGQVMQKYGVSEGEIEKRLQNTSTGDLVASINKLVGIIELERAAHKKSQEAEKIETAMRFTEPMKQVEEIKGIATEIKKHRILTDFDRIFTFIAANGRVKMGQISKELGIPRKRVEECCILLQKERQAEVNYPPIGDPFVQPVGFDEKLAQSKKIAKELAKEKKGKV